MKRFAIIAACAAFALCGCGSLISKTPTATFEFSGEAYGPAAATNPAGLTQASLAALAVRGVVVPNIYTDKDGNQIPFTVDGPCGTKEVPSLLGVSNANAGASFDNTGKPGVSGGHSEGMGWGQYAIIEALADLQKAAGPDHDVLKDYLTCPPSVLNASTAPPQ